MDNNFWISAAIAAVVGGAWLFKKGKSAYSFIRKIRRSFKGVCLNPKSRLTDEQCKKIAIGAMYASQQGAYQNSIETGIPDMLPKILGEWWRIETTEDARKELDYLCQKGYRYYFPFVYQAFLLDKPEEQDEIFQQNMTSQEDYDKIVMQFQNLQKTYEELLSCKVIVSKEDLWRCRLGCGTNLLPCPCLLRNGLHLRSGCLEIHRCGIRHGTFGILFVE